jgi:hypothetical protein
LHLPPDTQYFSVPPSAHDLACDRKAIPTRQPPSYLQIHHTDRRIIKKVTQKGSVGSRTPPPTITTLYINKNFEVRDYDQPVKYVFNGDTRVARITGTLEQSSPRVQRLRVYKGWNLLSLAVQADDAASQLGIGSDPKIQEIERWDAQTQGYFPVGVQDPLPAGSVFWLFASADTTLEVRGSYFESGKIDIAAGGSFLISPSLSAVPIESALPPEIDRAWLFDAATKFWYSKPCSCIKI